MWILYLIISFTVVFYVSMIIYQKVKENKTGIKKENGTRYTTSDSAFNESNETNITFVKDDILLKVDEIYYVGKKHKLAPGKYVVLSTVETICDIQIRLNGNIKNIKHNTSIILAEGDEITPLQNNLLLR